MHTAVRLEVKRKVSCVVCPDSFTHHGDHAEKYLWKCVVMLTGFYYIIPSNFFVLFEPYASLGSNPRGVSSHPV